MITYQHFETQQESGQDTVIRQSSSKKSLRSNRAIKPDKIYKLGENSYHKKIERQISFAPLIDDNAQIVDKLDGENSQKDTQRSY